LAIAIFAAKRENVVVKGVYLTAAELAASAFAGIPKEKSPARRYAVRQGWQTREGVRKGQRVIEF
jgi:hypothetical protein